MTTPDSRRYAAFLSSVYGGLEVERRQLGRDERLSVWVVDVQRPDLAHIHHRSPPEDIRRLTLCCLAAVRACDSLVWLITPRYGHTKLAGDALRVSLMEGEVLQAVLQLLPVHLVTIESDTALDDNVLSLAQTLRTTYRRRIASDTLCSRERVVTHVQHLLREHAPPRSVARCGLTFRRLVSRQSRAGGSRFVLPPPLAGPAPTVEAVRSLVVEAENVTYDYAYRLALLWVALRNLAPSRFSGTALGAERGTSDLAARALKAWESAAAWYGIHRHFGWGRYEAVNTLAREFGLDLQGSRASLHYSLATTGPLCVRSGALQRVDAALEQAKTSPISDSSGLMLIEAHRRSRLDLHWKRRPIFRWQPRRALRLAEYALWMRRERNESAARLGEAQVDVGWLLCLNGRWRKGLDEARRGFELLEQSGIEPGFEVQKRRVLGLCCLLNLRVRDAAQELAVAHRAAITWCAFDQIRWYTVVAGGLWAKMQRLARWIDHHGSR